MRTEILELKIYGIDELNEKAKQKAFDDWCNDDMYPFNTENESTLNEFQKIFPINVTSWSYGGDDHIYFTFTGDDNIKELSGLRLLKYLYNNYFDDLYKPKFFWKGNAASESKILKNNSCVLTGYYLDEDILEPIYKFLQNPDEYINFNDLIEKCLSSWVKTCSDDYENYYSMENFLEEARSNEWEFLENGKQYF